MDEEKMTQEEPVTSQKTPRTQKKKSITIRNLRTGSICIRGGLHIPALGQVELTQKQMSDDGLMRRVQSGIKTGQLREV